MPIPLRGDFETVELRREGEELERQRPGAPTIGAGCDLRRVDAHRGGEDRRRDASDRAGLGDEVQHAWSSGLMRRQAPGQTPRLTSEHRAALKLAWWRMARSLPFMAWCVGGLSTSAKLIFGAFHVVVSTQTVSRELRAMDYRKLPRRGSRHHAQATNAIEDFKKASRPAWSEIAREEERRSWLY